MYIKHDLLRRIKMKKQGDKDKEPRKSRANVDVDTLVSLYKNGKSCNEIADQIGITPMAVKYRLTQLGLYKGRRNSLKSILLKITKLENNIKSNELTESDKSTIRDKLYNLIMNL